MSDKRIWAFFYGAYMNFDVLKEVNLVPQDVEVARLGGFDISIKPLVNLVTSDQYHVYGIAATVTHKELHRLYTEHALGILGELYLPQAVIVKTRDEKFIAAVCYIAPSMVPKPASKDYMSKVLKPAHEFKLPEWYIKRLENFL